MKFIYPKKRAIVILSLLVNFLLVNAQSNKYYPEDLDAFNKYLEEITEYQIDHLERKYLSQKKKIYKNRLKWMIKQVKDSSFIFIPEINNKLNRVLDIIYDSNPELKEYDFYYLIDKSLIPNAASYGDGNFTINLGLFDFLESDDELAFIICHEIAHFLNDDFNLKMNNYLESVNSKETLSKVKEIKRKRYGRSTAGINLIKELSFDMFDYSRDIEMNADVLGFKLFNNTPYTKSAAISSLKKLGKLEDIIFSDSICLKDFFEFPEYSFNNKWIQKNRSLFNSSEAIDDYGFNKDSIRSHPYAKDRITNLLNNYTIDSLNNKRDLEVLQNLNKIIHPITIETLLDNKKYDILLYLALKDINKEINIEENYTLVAKSLKDIYTLKKNHTIGLYVARSTPFSTEKYLNKIRLFIHKIELRDLKNITVLFLKKNKNNINSNTYNETIKFFKP